MKQRPPHSWELHSRKSISYRRIRKVLPEVYGRNRPCAPVRKLSTNTTMSIRSISPAAGVLISKVKRFLPSTGPQHLVKVLHAYLQAKENQQTSQNKLKFAVLILVLSGVGCAEGSS